MKRVLAFLLFGAAAFAQEDDDLTLIPSAVLNAKTTPVASASAGGISRYAVEDVLTLVSYRSAPAVASHGSHPDWANRLSFDARRQWRLAPGLTLDVSDRLNVTLGDGVNFPRQALRNDWRELFVTWEALPQTFLEAGRINLRGGVAVGYNPTDFFKTRTAVATASADPSSARDNRLGTVMLRGQHLWKGGSLIVAYAPKLTDPSPLDAGANDGFGPHFDYTNAADRVLVGIDYSGIELNPQFLWYHESGRNRFGINMSYPVGDAFIVYGEWAGGNAPNAIAEAVAFGKRVGSLPASMPMLPQATTRRSFQSDAVLGFSWTGENKESAYVEYHFHQAGFTGRQWSDWFAIGAAPQSASAMWYLRGHAAAMQAPTGRHRLFLRLNQDDLWWDNFSLSLLAFVQPRDASTMLQLGAAYDLNDRWSFSAYAGGNFGATHSEWGSLSSAATFSITLSRYL